MPEKTVRRPSMQALAARVSSSTPCERSEKNTRNTEKCQRKCQRTFLTGRETPDSTGFSPREIALLRDLVCDLTWQERSQLLRDAQAGDPLSARIVETLGPPPLDPRRR